MGMQLKLGLKERVGIQVKLGLKVRVAIRVKVKWERGNKMGTRK